MKVSTISKFLCLFLSFLLLVGCATTKVDQNTTPNNNQNSPEGSKEIDEAEGSHTLTLKLNILNQDAKNDTYDVYFMPSGVKKTEPGEATQSGMVGPYTTDDNGSLTIDIENDYSLQYMVSENDKNTPNKLELYVTTKEDIYIRNPLNEKTTVDFIVLKDEDSNLAYDYLFAKTSLNLNITDSYPNGVLSLTFPDAIFVLKLIFETPSPKTAYEVSLYSPSDTSESGFGPYRTGRINRSFQYWDTPFFEKEVTGARAVIITDFDTDKEIVYDGYPLWLNFNDDGTCVEGDIIVITMPLGS